MPGDSGSILSVEWLGKFPTSFGLTGKTDWINRGSGYRVAGGLGAIAAACPANEGLAEDWGRKETLFPNLQLRGVILRKCASAPLVAPRSLINGVFRVLP
jgi:hypothetical protein